MKSCIDEALKNMRDFTEKASFPELVALRHMESLIENLA